MPKELTKFQLSSRLSYQQTAPKFLRRYQNEVAGRPNTPSDDEEFVEGAVDEFGREIRRRSPLPSGSGVSGSRDRNGEEEEEEVERDEVGDEAPQVVVLKQGKHLTAEEAENEKRRAKGLPPLAKPMDDDIKTSSTEPSTPSKPQNPKTSLNFSSGSSNSNVPKNKAKRKLEALSESNQYEPTEKKKANKSKKPKKEKKGLLSFGDGND